jgi:hypothetical protein
MMKVGRFRAYGGWNALCLQETVMADTQNADPRELRQELVAHRALLASLATLLILDAGDKHKKLEQIFTEALDQVDRDVPHDDADREAIKHKVHELADLVQHAQ